MKALEVDAGTFTIMGGVYEVVTVTLEALTWHTVESFARPARTGEGYVSHPMHPIVGDWDLEELLDLWVEMYEGDGGILRRLWVFQVRTGDGAFFGVAPELVGDSWDLGTFAFSGTVTEGIEGGELYSSDLN